MSFSQIARISIENNFNPEHSSLTAIDLNASGINLAKQGKHSEAIQEFEKAIKI